ncbi:metallophosphoesterase family protein [Paenibacillus thermoaerophilus]|uniref:Metallophosphoesterase family protein n=1 Tax=Paenibacillus thermoaerophilus TaxID=1215385 RepID=A0ABW2V4J2_9BACL|nr:metallophosphoesterase family protein [Paenibacillus thermoaerophilus]TMV18480.1 metallophosphoesterase family protein [Paenibacillus thermoaerophilus]
MERIAVLSDIHGNMPALEAALADIRKRGISRIICLGDLVGKGPEPVEAIERVRETCEAVVQGNWDHGITLPQTKPGGIWQRDRLRDEDVAYLLSLPFHVDLRLSGRLIRLFHASAESIYHRVQRKAPKDAKLAMFDHTAATGETPDGRTPDVVVYGDIHTAYHEIVYRKNKSASPPVKRGLQLINTGSVGLPYDGIAQAGYVILEGESESGSGGRDASDGNAAGSFSFTFVRVPYDIEQAIGIARRLGLPDLDRYAFELRTATELKHT